jgi:transcriptional regulator of aromatic amino acid metabolism
MNYTFKIYTKDEPSLTYKILGIFDKLEINITALEVKPSLIHIQFDVNKNLQKIEIQQKILNLSSVIRVEENAILPSQINYLNLLDMFNFLEESIIITDLDFSIIFSNSGFKKANKKNHRSLSSYFLQKSIFKDIQDGADSIELISKDNLRYIATIRPYESIITKEKQLFWVLHESEKLQKKSTLIKIRVSALMIFFTAVIRWIQ